MNVLQIDCDPDYPPTNGKETRVWKTATYLQDYVTVHLACPSLAGAPIPDGVTPISLGGAWLKHKVLKTHLWFGSCLLVSDNVVHDHLTSKICSAIPTDIPFDVVMSESPQTTGAALRIARSQDALLLLNKHNSYYSLFDSLLAERNVPRYVRERAVRNLKTVEERAIETADIVVFQSDADRARYNIPDGTTDTVIPNGCDFELIRNSGTTPGLAEQIGIDAERPICLFVGSYDYGPNATAARLIANELAPNLTNIDFLLVGRNPPVTSRENVYAPGFVKDLPGVLNLADIALCPLQSGSGTKLKVLDYLAAGLPIVTTSIGAQGLPLTDGQSALIRDEIGGFRTAIRRLTNSEEQRRTLSANAVELGEQYAWDNLLEQYVDLLEAS